MSVTMPKQPHCVCCNRPIAKATERIRFTSMSDGRKPVAGKETCRSKAEAQRFVNQPIVSVRYSDIYGDIDAPPVDRVVSSVSTWDGKSYEDAWFCNGNCRTRWAYAQAKRQWPAGRML